MDYTTIQDPYSEFVDRTIASEQPVSPDQDVREGDSVKDLWIRSFIRSVNWRPGNTGFNIDGTTGAAQFQDISIRRAHIKKNIFISNEITTIGNGNYVTLSVDSSVLGVPGSGSLMSMATTDVGKSTGIDIGLNGAYGANTVKGISLETWTGSGTGDHFGIVINMPNSFGGAAYAFGFNGSEITNTAVGGTQDKKIKIKIAGTVYYIPCYTA